MKKKLISLLTLTFLLTNVSYVSFAKEETSNNENDKPKYESRSVGTNISLINDGGSSVNPWRYQYTAPPYHFYKHIITGEVKMVQYVSTWDYTFNIVKTGWESAMIPAPNKPGQPPKPNIIYPIYYTP